MHNCFLSASDRRAFERELTRVRVNACGYRVLYEAVLVSLPSSALEIIIMYSLLYIYIYIPLPVYPWV